MWQFLVGPISDLVTTVLKRVLPPEKMTEAERMKLEAELRLALLQADWTRIEAEFRDRDSARRLAAAEIAQGNAWTSVLAALVRPIWGLTSLVVVVYPYLAAPLGLPAVSIDEPTKDIIQLVIMFYFGGRVIEKVLPTLKNGNVQR